jgi:starch synthase
MSYQGMFWHWDMVLTGLDWRYFNWKQMEYYGQLNLLKTGIVFADALTTVSPTYAREIQSAPLGCGLEGVLSDRRDVLTGIVNGVDYGVWNPATDRHLAAKYDAAGYVTGKAACKAALQRELGLPVLPGAPLIGIIGRLVNQKGFDLIAPVLDRWLDAADAQWVVLGTGEKQYEELLGQLAQRYPHKLAARLQFSDALAHKIEAGADIFLMPSLFEPCGLNQMYSLKYGTVPVVRATGGLADTIVDATPENLAARKATGFAFHEYSAFSMEEALLRAVTAYKTQPREWHQLVTTGMRQDYSWAASAKEYTSIYDRTVANKRGQLR